MFISLLLSTLLGTADAVPLQLTQQGRVLDNNGAAVTGIQDLTFRIYDASTGGSVYWSETVTVNFNNGYYATVLGADEVNNALDSSTLSLYPLYLEVQLNNNAPMSTRYAINSAPYAQMAGNAEVATSVDGGNVNATEVSINASQVIDGNGNWVGQPITVDWNNIDPNTIPSYIADGDDNTQLSEGQVEQYVTNDVINLASGSQVGGSDIVTVATDSDTLAGLSCTSGEIAGWNGSAWTCVSDNTLTVSDVSTMLTNNAVDLNTSTTIGGLAIITEIDDSDTLANLSCANDGEIARYDLALDEWYCDTDIDTVLDENTVETYVTNGAIDLDANTTIDGNPILTTITDSDVLAGLGCSDDQVAKYDSSNGAWACADDTDTDTQLSEGQVENFVTNDAIDLDSSTTIGGNSILTSADTLTPDWNNLTSIPSDIDDGDDDTLASLGCSDGETPSYDVSSGSWVCSSSSSGGSVEVGTYVGDGASAQVIGLTNNPTTAEVVNSSLGFLVHANSNDQYEIMANLSSSDQYGDGSAGVFLGTTNTSLNGTSFEYESFSIMPGRVVSIDSGNNGDGTVIYSQGEVDIQGNIVIAQRPNGSASSGNNASGTCCRGGNGSSGSLNFTDSELNSVTALTGQSGGTGGWGRDSYGRNCGTRGSGGAGGGGLTIISPVKITIGQFGLINIIGDAGTSGGGSCYNSSSYGGDGGNGSSGVLKLIAPYIEIEGSIQLYDGGGSNNGILVLSGMNDYSNALETPSNISEFIGLSTDSSNQFIDNINFGVNSLSVSGVLNISGRSYTYVVQ